MAKETKKATKVTHRGGTRKATASKAKPIAASPTSATESKKVLAKGCEWYDDGGNEGLKQRPI